MLPTGSSNNRTKGLAIIVPLAVTIKQWLLALVALWGYLSDWTAVSKRYLVCHGTGMGQAFGAMVQNWYMVEWKPVKVSAEVKEMLDEDWKGGETRDAQMRRLLNGESDNGVPEGIQAILEANQEELNKLRRELDETRNAIPRQVAQELR